MADTTTFRSNMRYATSKAIDDLLAGVPGQTINRDEMAAAIGEPCEWGTPGHRSVCTAIKHVEGRKTWRWDRDIQAWRCLSDSEASEVCCRLQKQATRRARRGLKVAVGVDTKQLNPDQLRDHNLTVCVSSIIANTGSHQFRKQLSDKTNGTSGLIGPNYNQLAQLVTPAN